MTVRCSLGHENPDGSAFCDECGEPLEGAAPVATAAAPSAAPATQASSSGGTQVCPSCGSVNPAGEAFCSNCGSMLGEPAATAAPATVEPSAPAAAPAAPAVAAALNARLIVEADNQEFDLSGKDNVLIGREDAVSNIFPDVDLTPTAEKRVVYRVCTHAFLPKTASICWKMRIVRISRSSIVRSWPRRRQPLCTITMK